MSNIFFLIRKMCPSNCNPNPIVKVSTIENVTLSIFYRIGLYFRFRTKQTNEKRFVGNCRFVPDHPVRGTRC